MDFVVYSIKVGCRNAHEDILEFRKKNFLPCFSYLSKLLKENIFVFRIIANLRAC